MLDEHGLRARRGFSSKGCAVQIPGVMQHPHNRNALFVGEVKQNVQRRGRLATDTWYQFGPRPHHPGLLCQSAGRLPDRVHNTISAAGFSWAMNNQASSKSV